MPLYTELLVKDIIRALSNANEDQLRVIAEFLAPYLPANNNSLPI